MFSNIFKSKSNEEPPVKKFNITTEIVSKNEDQRLIFGWASVIEKNGEAIEDSQGDVIDEPTLITAAHKFVCEARMAKAMHKGESVGEVVESMVFTKDVQKALGIDLGQVGWFIAMKVHDDNVWKKVKDGEFRAFSIGGRGVREDV